MYIVVSVTKPRRAGRKRKENVRAENLLPSHSLKIGQIRRGALIGERVGFAICPDGAEKGTERKKNRRVRLKSHREQAKVSKGDVFFRRKFASR